MKVTVPVMPGDDHHCIDDVRWQKFLKLALSGDTHPEIRTPNNIYEDWMVGNPSSASSSVSINSDWPLNYMWLSDNGWFKSSEPHYPPGFGGSSSVPNSPYRFSGGTQGETKKIYIKWAGEIIWI